MFYTTFYEENAMNITILQLRAPSETMVDLQRGFSRHAGKKAKNTRNYFLHYFNNEGAVQWQNKFV